MKRLFRMSVPVILSFTLQNSLQTVSILIVGRLGPLELATSAFSFMFAMCSGWLIQLGGTTAIDTLGSATYTAAEDPHELGVILQRGFFVFGVLYVPICILWMWSEPVLLMLGQTPELAYSASRFLQCLIPGGLGYIYFESLKKYLQVQGIMQAGTYVLLATSPINAILNWLFVHTFNGGLYGAPLATGVTYWLSFIGLVLYCKYVNGSQAWGGFSIRAFQNLAIFFKLAIMGIIMIGTEWWAFEVIALEAGRLGNIALAAQSVVMTSDQVTFTIPFGIGVATSTRVGNLLGDRKPRSAQRAAYSGAFLAAFVGSVVMVIMFTARNLYGRMFSDDIDVIRETARIVPFVALFQIADGLNSTCCGVLRGMGRQHIGALVNSAAYYILALPTGIYWAFHGRGLPGLWQANCGALYLAGLTELTIVAHTNWKLEVQKALDRLDAYPEDLRGPAGHAGQPGPGQSRPGARGRPGACCLPGACGRPGHNDVRAEPTAGKQLNASALAPGPGGLL
ncbi:mate-domain-containing protein [Dipodascopsis tothii]|uniref:mate-domain-containing protein n=1 Tax=Dipodascopsis tothii TaxID=44089 RepID=UPI0034CFD990